MPYSILHQRPLTIEERQLLVFLLAREAPSRLSEIDTLNVVARCGCGQCPTIMFTADSNQPFSMLADYVGRDAQGTVVGVALLERAGILAKLEAW